MSDNSNSNAASVLPLDTIEISLYGLARHGTPYLDESTGTIYISLPERIPFQDRDDTRIHVCREGETLPGLAVAYYAGQVDSPVSYWPVIAEYQDPPIIDGSMPLEAGTVVLIPSMAFIRETVNGDSLVDTPKM